MKFHNIEMRGDFKNHMIDAIPVFDPADEGRSAYLTTEGSLWYCTDVKWVEVSGGGGTSFDVDQVNIGITASVLTPLYLDDDGIWKLAIANDMNTVGTHVVIEVDNDDRVVVSQSGLWNIETGLMTYGDYYTSSITAGAVTQIKPTPIVNRIFTITDNDRVLVSPYIPYNENIIDNDEDDFYSDLLRTSVFKSCSFDDFGTTNYIDTVSGTFNEITRSYEFTNGQSITSLNLFDSLSGLTTVTLLMMSLYIEGTGTLQVSTDGGSHWLTVSNNEIEHIQYAGDDIRLRFTSSGNSILSSWGVLYNRDPSVNSEQHALVKSRFVASNGQTDFSMSYYPSHTLVILNGDVLDESDYDDSSGNIISLNQPCSLGDLLFVLTFGVFDLTDSDFIRLNDTPSSFVNEASKILAVNSGESALEFINHTILTLNDTPNNYTGESGNNLAVNSGESALEFIIPVIESGSKLPFYQANAPTGWTQDTSINNQMIRVVDGVGGGSGGTDSPILMDKVPVHSHTGSSDTTGDHNHSYTSTTLTSDNVDGTNLGSNPSSIGSTTDSAGDHQHIITVDDNSGENWEPMYIDVIICTKD